MALPANDQNPPDISTQPGTPLSPPQTGTPQHSTHTGTTAQTSLQIWQSFTAYARGIRPKRETVFEDKVATTAMNQRRIERIWVRSNEANSAAFDIAASSATSPSDFLRALTSAYPEAVGTIPSKHSATCVIVAFVTPEARDWACSVGVVVNEFTFLGMPTIDMESTAYQIALEGLPLVPRDILGPALRTTFSRYGKVLGVQLCTDSFGLLTSKGFILLDTSSADSVSDSGYQRLEHEVHFEAGGKKRIILARWRGMAIHRNYCKKEGHKVVSCPKLQARKEKPVRKLCCNCDSADHLAASCPKNTDIRLGEKRRRFNHSSQGVDTTTAVPPPSTKQQPAIPELRGASKEHIIPETRNTKGAIQTDDSDNAMIVENDEDDNLSVGYDGARDGSTYDYEEERDDLFSDHGSTNNDKQELPDGSHHNTSL
ncbi:hypothetical protein DFQ30_008974 [Apophysomyces sp. BC1015]|nr:hypothetical protein DFQ30_008974 [Apophysomyces sp. BC1015]